MSLVEVALGMSIPETIALLAIALGLALAVFVIKAAVRLKQRKLRRQWLARRKTSKKEP